MLEFGNRLLARRFDLAKTIKLYEYTVMQPQSSAATAASPVSDPGVLPGVFRIGDLGSSVSAPGGGEIRSGFDALDDELTGRGWAKPGLTEILCNHVGIGELSLLMKALGSSANVVHHGEAMHMLWVMPHNQAWVPYAPALAQCGINLDHLAIVRTKNTEDALWAAEQGLKSGACRSVLLRMNEVWCNPLSLRRLHQAAMAGSSILWLVRPLEALNTPSPAGTRIALQPEDGGVLRLDLIKRRGLPAGKSLRLVPRTLACLTREPRYVRTPQKAASIRWLDRILTGNMATAGENPVNVRQRSFTRERDSFDPAR